MRFNSKVFVVTGGTGGLGGAVSRRLLDEGARVHVTWIVATEADAFKVSLGAAADSCVLHQLDILDEEDVIAFVAELFAAEGRIDGLCNLVGGYVGSMSVIDTDLARWDFLLNLNVRTALTMCKHIVPHMLAGGAGKIVNVSARRAHQGAAGLSAYSASKAAVLRFTEALAAEVLHNNVQVNAILPSTIDTAQNRAASPNADYSDWVSPDDIAAVVAYLCSPEADIITGAGIPVYGRA
jgi:NAD(P)-dependent dehydrogenase (short-subunit alcohol dehydrogenase family)